MSNKLAFFDKDGNYLNFRYDDISQTYNGDLVFHENSSDTFKTIGLYTFEKIDSFEFEDSNLDLEKFQLFNEYGINFTGSTYATQSIYNIEAVNNDPSFYSKWIYGNNFESKYPIGSEIVFNESIFEFTSTLKSYTVVSSKKNAIMIISTMNNSTFNINFQILSGLTSSYVDKTISGINSIGVNNYIGFTSSINNLSIWSEPNFYKMTYNGRKLNIVNSNKNDGVVTIKNNKIFDKVYYQYYVNSIDLPTNYNLIIEVVLKTDLPIIYKGSLVIKSDRIEFGDDIPKILKPDTQISLKGSISNDDIFINISSIPTFLGNTQLTNYATASQILWNNSIYQCVQAYTQSATSSITPDDTIYWTNNITYLPVDEILTSEILLYGEVYLTTNKFYYDSTIYGFTVSNSDMLLNYTAEKYNSEFNSLNIDLYYNNRTLYSNLIYSSEYANVNFYHTKVGTTYSIGGLNRMYENTIQVSETLVPEINQDISERSTYNIVFTDIDEYGINININGLVYQQEVQFVYSGLNIDLQRTIDKTLRAWVSKYALSLYKLGISCNLDYLVNYPYIYFDSIVLHTIYPNVPINFTVYIGTTANYYIQHSNITFFDIDNILSITINRRNYVVNFDTDISTTISNWIDEYSSILDDYKIFVSKINNTIYFNIKSQNTDIDYIVNIGKSSIPGITQYKIVNKIKGNFGCLITSNAAILSATESSFLDINGSDELGDTGFATGMIISVNNTQYPFNNQEYNILEVDDDRLVFSYQGPFWGNTSSINLSPFSNGFNIGFSASATIGTSSYLGAFSNAFDNSFDIMQTDTIVYSYGTYPGIGNMIDIVYINTSELVYVLGDSLLTYDGISGDLYDTISLPGLSQSIKLVYNNIDEYLYVLTSTLLYKIEPITNSIVSSFTYSSSDIPYDCIINEQNGDIYISYSNNYIDIIDVSSNRYTVTLSYPGAPGLYKMAYNAFENYIYITADNDNVMGINGVSRIQSDVYSITSLNHTLVYEPINSSIYVMGDLLYQINDGIINSTTYVGNTFSDIIYDNINQKISISIVNNFGSINLDNSVNYSSITSDHGFLTINQYDESVYMYGGDTNDILIIEPLTGYIKQVVSLSSKVTRLIYNPIRKSMWGIMPSSNTIVEIIVDISFSIVESDIAYNGINESQFGTLDPNYIQRPSIWIKSRDYIRKPRENFDGDARVSYVWKWATDDILDIFMYDFSGKQLLTTGPYAYIGEKPLQNINLNKYSNKDLSKTGSSAYQQTIFSEIVEELDYVNSTTNISYTPEPLELFIGYNSADEGISRRNLVLYRREDIYFQIITDNSNFNNIKFEKKYYENGIAYGIISLDSNSSDNFLYDSNDNKRGLKVNQEVQIFVKDNTNAKNKYISFNNGLKFLITGIYLKTIVVKFLSGVFTNEETTIINYPSFDKVTYMTTTFKVVDKEIGNFSISGQTEIEDIRFKTELNNLGKNITADDVFIFKTYDINEQGVDWTFLNKKRKEMLMVKDDIYPYIGSYKSIINAINYFGYNDLELYEYYRNINTNSSEYNKLVKVEIPDIFDNSVSGWKENDFIKHIIPNSNYEDTNLFNLTYRITDKQGNNVLLYSLPEVLVKLQGLKYWMQRNIIPLSHRILDITGQADFAGPNSIIHKSYDSKNFVMNQSMSPIDGAINEAYLMPINSGSTVYNVVVDFYNQDKDMVPDYFNFIIRTYKTYPEWKPFKIYNNGSIITYYQQLYESVISNNKLNDPRKYNNIASWNINFDYLQGQIVEYNKNFYEFIGTQSVLLSGTSSINTPFIDVLYTYNNWLDVTEWKKIDYMPIQTLKEFRTATHSYHFTIDTNIDPFVTLEITSDNGYGQIYTSKKNYELRSLLDIDDGLGELEEIGPIKIYDFLTSTTTTTTTIPDNVTYVWEPIDPYCEDE